MEETNFIEWLHLKGLSEGTTRQYLYYYRRLPWKKIDHGSLFQFMKKHNNMVARAFLTNFMQYIRMDPLVPKDIKQAMEGFEIPSITGRKKKKLINVLSRDEIHLIANQMKHKRDKIMLMLTYYGGLRVSELLKIRPIDFFWTEWKVSQDQIGRVKVQGKGGKERKVIMPSQLMNMIYYWINEEISDHQDKEGPLFNLSPKGIQWRKILSAASNKAIGRKINPHLLRHSTATYLIEKGLNLKEIADYLGHKNINTTAMYTHLNKKKLQAKIGKAFQ